MPVPVITIAAAAMKLFGKRGQKATAQQKCWRCMAVSLVIALVGGLVQWLFPEWGASVIAILTLMS